jgi:flagellar biosynthesis/type III secretory pathway protein FliH
MAPQTRDLKNSPTLEEYRPTPYKEEVWPVISDEQEDSVFRVAEFEKVSEGEFEVDAMFADFSRLPKDVIELNKDAGEFDLTPSEVQTDLDLETLEEELKADATSRKVAQAVDVSEPEANTAARTEGVNHAEVSTQSVNEIEPFESQDQLEDKEVTLDTETQSETAGDELRISQSKLEEALEQAYQKGLVDSAEQVRQMQSKFEEQYSLLWEDMQTQLQESICLQEQKSVELSMLVAKRLVGDVVEGKRDYIVGVIKEAFRSAADVKVLEVRVGPADYEFLKLGEYGAPDRIISGEKLSFVSDDSIRSGCILTTTRGAIDLDLDRAWTRINEKVAKES